MKKVYTFFIILLFGSIAFGQVIDSDFDGIPDSIDHRPFVTDVPKLYISMGNVTFGIKYKVSGNTIITNSKSVTIERNESLTNTELTKTYKIKETTQKISNSIAGAINFPLENGVSSLGLSVKYDNESTNTFKYSNEVSKESINRYNNNAKEFIDWNQSTTIQYNYNSGYIKSSLKIQNLGLNTIKVVDLIVKLIEFDPNTEEEINVLKVINLGTHEIDPSDDEIQSYGIPITIDSVSTNEILSIMQKKNLIKVEIQRYKIEYNRIEFTPSILNRALRDNTIKVNVIDQFKNYNEYHISVKAGTGNSISLKNALLQLYNTPIEIKDTIIDGKRINHLSLFNGKKSDFIFWKDPKSYRENELNHGAWIVIPNNDRILNVPFIEDVFPNSEYTILFVTKQELWEKFRITESYSGFYGDTKTTEGNYYWKIQYPFPMNQDQGKANKKAVQSFESQNKLFRPLEISQPEFKFSMGDIVTFEFIYKKASLIVKDSMVFFQPRCGARNCTGDWSVFKGTLRRIIVNEFVVQEPGIENLNIGIQINNTGKVILLHELLSVARGSYKILPNGKIIVSFIPNAELIKLSNSTFKIVIFPIEEKFNFGMDIVRGSGFRFSKFEDRKIRVPFTINLNLTISHPPKIEDNITPKEMNFLIKSFDPKN